LLGQGSGATVNRGHRGRCPADLPWTAGGQRAAQLGPAGVVRENPDGTNLGRWRPHGENRGTGGTRRDQPRHVLLDAPPRTVPGTGAGPLGKDRRRGTGRAAAGVVSLGRRGSGQVGAGVFRRCRGGPVRGLGPLPRAAPFRPWAGQPTVGS